MFHLRTILGCLSILLGTLIPTAAGASTLDFDSLAPGTIVNSQFAGVQISVFNAGGGPHVGTVYNSNTQGGADPDLEGPWSVGNLAPDTPLGNLLIIAEDGTTTDGLIDVPDDEAGGGQIQFVFQDPMGVFGFDLIDVETTQSGFVSLLSGNSELLRIDFEDFANPQSGFFVPDLVFGNNSANRIESLSAASLGISAFDTLVFDLGGSAALDNVHFYAQGDSSQSVPEPSTLLLGGLALVALSFMRTRSRS